MLNTMALTIWGRLGVSSNCAESCEVGEYLKLLKLDKYVETFKNEMVDGTFLIDMDEELLKDDFEFKRIEAKRLLRFASEGHMPR